MRKLLAIIYLVPTIALGEVYPRFSSYPKFIEVKTALSSTQILALDASPVTLTAPTLSTCIPVLYGFSVDKPAGTAYAGVAAGDDLVIENSGSTIHITIETTGFLDQATRQRRSGAAGASFSPAALPDASFGLALRVRLLGPITTGTSPLILTIVYLQECNP